MFPDECENCGLETKDLVEREKVNTNYDYSLNWFICKPCEGRLYPHEFYPSPEFKDLCNSCGKPFKNDIHV